MESRIRDFGEVEYAKWPEKGQTVWIEGKPYKVWGAPLEDMPTAKILVVSGGKRLNDEEPERIVFVVEETDE